MELRTNRKKKSEFENRRYNPPVVPFLCCLTPGVMITQPGETNVKLKSHLTITTFRYAPNFSNEISEIGRPNVQHLKTKKIIKISYFKNIWTI